MSALENLVERRRGNAFRVARLGMCEGLSKRERNFVRHMSQRRKFSPQEQTKFDELVAKYLSECHE